MIQVTIGIAAGYVPGGRDLSPGRGKGFFFTHIVQTGAGAHTASWPMDTGGFFPGSRAVRA
jgi:hypothetical protein